MARGRPDLRVHVKKRGPRATWGATRPSSFERICAPDRSQRAGEARMASIWTGSPSLRRVIHASASASSVGIETLLCARMRGPNGVAPSRRSRERRRWCGRGRFQRACGVRARGSCVRGRRRRCSCPGVRIRRVRGDSDPEMAPNNPKTSDFGANRSSTLDRSPLMCFAGRFDIIRLLHDEVRGLRRPERARHSPEAASAANRRMAAAALCGRIRALFEAPAVRLPIARPERRFDTPGRCGESHGPPLGGKNH